MELVEDKSDQLDSSDTSTLPVPDLPETKPTKATSTEPQTLCTCPQKCYKRVPQDVKENLHKEFNRLRDNAQQNEYLQSFIEMRSVYKRLWAQEERVGGRLQRRVSCKYRIPLDDKEPVNLHPQHKPKINSNSKGKVSYVANVKEGVRTIEVCQKAFMNIYGITEKRIRLQREKLIAKLRSKTFELDPSLLPTIEDDMKADHGKEIEWTPEQAALETFFRNQLWQPEYIGMTTDVKIPAEREPAQKDLKT